MTTLPPSRTSPVRAVSVVVCAFSLERWDLLAAALASVAAQDAPASETILVIDHNHALLARARAAFPSVNVIASTGARGLSGARNTGVRAATGSIVAFLDDDASADPSWLRHLTGVYDREDVIGTGGQIVPSWEGPAPSWLPSEFQWIVGCTPPRPDGIVDVRNPVGASMSFRRSVFDRAGYFSVGLGRVGKVPLGCEETELAIRATGAIGGRILHVPAARVAHHVPRERTTWRYFVRRCWAEGLSKAAVGRAVGRRRGASAEWLYVTRTLPLGVARGLRRAVRGDLDGLTTSVVIVAGVAVTAAGYVAGSLRTAWSRP